MSRISLLSRSKDRPVADSSENVASPPPQPTPPGPRNKLGASMPSFKRGRSKDGAATVPAIGNGAVGLPTPPKRQRSTGWMIGGAALILISGFAAASMAQTYTETVDVLVAAEAIAEGEPIRAEHLEVVPIAAGEGEIQAIHPTGLEDLIGRVASGPIGAGSILHPDQFAGVEAEEQMVIVGMALEPDEFPTNGLQRGDLVRLFDVNKTFGRSDPGVAEEITIGEIVAVEPLKTGSQFHFSIRVKESTANVITSRATQDSLAIALAESESGDVSQLAEALEPGDDIDPLDPAEPLEPGEPLTAGEAASEDDQ